MLDPRSDWIVQLPCCVHWIRGPSSLACELGRTAAMEDLSLADLLQGLEDVQTRKTTVRGS